jgi:lipopolysaccharide/colanic/teichoic acid biosynthesis glycosyltransferase
MLFNLNSKEKISLFLGDILFISLSIYLSYIIRYFSIPDIFQILNFIAPFTYIIVIWFVVFFISGMYEGQTLNLQKKSSKIIINSQIINLVVTALYFYLFSSYQVYQATPKTILLIYIVISTLLLLFWRLFLYKKISKTKRKKALLIANGEESEELRKEINNNNRYPFYFEKTIDSKSEIQQIDSDFNFSSYDIIVVDKNSIQNKHVSEYIYKDLFINNSANYVDFSDLYESVFRKIALSSINHEWILENISLADKNIYTFLKRLIDIFLSLILLIPLTIVYPFVWIAIKLEDGGDINLPQKRIGEYGKEILINKFRSMTGNEDGKWLQEGTLRVTKVGSFLRKSRIDELPQIISVLKGESSLIGPRSDLGGLSIKLIDSIPYYQVRYVVKPGLSGWAQVTQEGLPPQSIDETKLRLSYDLYYIKNRSIWLDILIVLKTIKTLSMRVGI